MNDKVVTSNKPEDEEKKKNKIPPGLRSDGQWHAAVDAMRVQNKPLYFIQRRNTTLEVETSLARARVWVTKQHDSSLRIFERDWSGNMTEVA